MIYAGHIELDGPKKNYTDETWFPAPFPLVSIQYYNCGGYFLFSSFADGDLIILFLSCDYQLSWTGDKASKELQEANISVQNFPILQQCAKKVIIIIKIQCDESSNAICQFLLNFVMICITPKAIRIASEAEPDVSHLTGMASLVLEGNLTPLSCFSYA